MNKKIYILGGLLTVLIVVGIVDGIWKDSKDIFECEISGHLSEGLSNINFEEKVIDVMSNTQHSNKLLRWGISRKSNNQTPDANPGSPEIIKKYDGIYIGDTNKNDIYLTFDEGYENGYTSKILDTLKDNSVKAVFFITGPYLKEHQDLVKRMIEEGHIVGNHTVGHPSLPDISDKEIEDEVNELDRMFYQNYGKHMKYLRPPKGEYSERTLAITHKLGYINMFWSLAYDDWYRDKIRGADYTYDLIMRNLHKGAIILLHAVSKDNADALDMIIKGAKSKGYNIGNIQDII